MRLYQFSPIETRGQLLEAVTYVVQHAEALCTKITSTIVPISSVTIFAHYPHEYAVLCELLKTMGTVVGEVNGPRVALTVPVQTGDSTVTHLRIRTPDPYHLQVGCTDWDVADYAAFKHAYLPTNPHNLRLLVRPDYELIEAYDPDFDVTAYILSQPERSKKGN